MGLSAAAIVIQCAWCKRIEMRIGIDRGHSLSAPALVDEIDLLTAHGTRHYHVSHGICADCSNRLMDGRKPGQTS